MDRRSRLPVVAIVALLVVGLGLWAAAPASAAPKPIGLSLDGITYTDDLPTSLFADAVIVPGDTALRSFYVKNRAADAGNLAVALQGVTGIDSVMISALSVSADAGAASGSSVAFTSANPCRSLVSGVGLASGGVVRVDVYLTLGSSLTGRTSQSSVGSFDLHVTLTSTDVAAPNGCAAVTPPPPTGGGGGSGGSGGGTHTSTPTGEIDSSIVSGAAAGAVPGGSPIPNSSGSGGGFVAAYIEPNTGRFFQELFVAGWLAAMVLGGIVAWWRRRNDTEEAYR